MIRVVRAGERLVDGTNPRLPGRGAYVHEDCVDLAHSRRAFHRALGVAGAAPFPAGSKDDGAI